MDDIEQLLWSQRMRNIRCSYIIQGQKKAREGAGSNRSADIYSYKSVMSLLMISRWSHPPHLW